MSKMKKPPLGLNIVIEPFGVLEFSSVKELRRHVVKHCLEAPSQRWQEFFTGQKFQAALMAYRCNLPHDTALLDVMELYRSLLSEVVVKNCEVGTRHLHFLAQRWRTHPHQVAEIWDYGRKLKIIAKAFVINNQIQPYVLCSGFRCFPDFTEQGFRKEVVKRLNEKSFIRNNAENPNDCDKMTLIADHSGLIQE